jgi:hypothetical protein
VVTRLGPTVPLLREHIADERPVDHRVHVELLDGDDRLPQLGIGVTLVGDAVTPVRREVRA